MALAYWGQPKAWVAPSRSSRARVAPGSKASWQSTSPPSSMVWSSPTPKPPIQKKGMGDHSTSSGVKSR